MSTQKLLNFVQGITQLLDSKPDESTLLTDGKALLAELVAADDWLPEQFAKPHPQYYQQYLLYADPLDRLSIVSFVWGPARRHRSTTT